MKRRRLLGACALFGTLTLSSGSLAQDLLDGDDAAERNLFERLPRHKLQASLDRILKNELPFCARADYRPAHDATLCKLSKAEQQRCPALARACESPPPKEASPKSESLAWLSAVSDLVFWGVLCALGVALIVAIARIFANFAKERAAREPERAREPGEPSALAERATRETDVDRLLSRARAAAESARFDEALSCVHAALVHALSAAGRLSVDPARTNGDYLRELRAHPKVHAAIQDIFRSIEGVQFGGRAASLSTFESVLARALPILKNIGTALCLFLALHGITACAQSELEHPEESAAGYHVLTSLLTENGTKVRKRIREIGVIDSDVAEILVIGELEPELRTRLFEWVLRGGSLTVTAPVRELEEASGIRYKNEACSGKIELGPGFESAKLNMFGEGLRTLEFGEPEDGESVQWLTATCDNHPYVAATSYGDGTVTVVAEAELFTNASLSIADNAYFAVSLLSSPGSTLELVGPWTGGGASSPLASLQNAGLGPALAELLVFALLVAWRYGSAFGKRRDPTTLARRAFVEHVRALGNVYRRAGASRFALASYGAWAIDRLRERIAPGEALGVIDLSTAIARKTSEPEALVVQLLAEARHAQEAALSETRSPQDLQTLERLEALVFRTGGNK